MSPLSFPAHNEANDIEKMEEKGLAHKVGSCPHARFTPDFACIANNRPL